MQIIPLSKGQFALVDDEDYEYLNQWKWSYGGRGYAIRYSYANNQKIYYNMHRVILKAQPGQLIDHINQNKLDNRKVNLRFCNLAQNRMNSKISSNNTSQYRGVSWHKYYKKWQATIKHNGKRIYLGRYNNIEEAVKIYNQKAVELYGEFAYLNKGNK